MNLEGCREAYKDYSRTASEVNRNLAFAALAVVWIFRLDQKEGTLLPVELVLPTILSVFSLALDLLHYASSAAIYAGYGRMMERAGIKDGDAFEMSPRMNWLGLTFFWLKLISLIAAYIFLLGFLWHRLYP